MNGPFALTGHMVKIRHTGWQKSVASSTGTSRKQRKVKLDRLEFLCVRIYYILLPSSMADFVPCDQLVQKAHSAVYAVKLSEPMNFSLSPSEEMGDCTVKKTIFVLGGNRTHDLRI